MRPEPKPVGRTRHGQLAHFGTALVSHGAAGPLHVLHQREQDRVHEGVVVAVGQERLDQGVADHGLGLHAEDAAPHRVEHLDLLVRADR